MQVRLSVGGALAFVLAAGLWNPGVLGAGPGASPDGTGPGVMSSCSIHVAPVARLGDLADDWSLTTPVGVDVAPLPSGAGWVVADLDGEQTLRYGPEGDYGGEFLPRGQGPGEVEAPARVTLDAFDSLWVTHGRGRAVISDEDGEGRTVVSADQFGVDGHTPSGLPFAMAFWTPLDEAGAPRVDRSVAGAIVMDREGNALYELGPIVSISEAARGVGPTRPLQPTGLAALGDSVLLGPDPTDPEVWVRTWTVEGGEPFVSSESIRRALGDRISEFDKPFDGGVLGLRSSGEGGAWGLGWVTVLPEAEQNRLRQELAEALDFDGRNTVYVRYHPAVANQAHRTVLFHMLDDGTVTEAVLMEGMPRGFVDQDQYFTLSESEAGVLEVRIWRFERRCDEG